MTCACGVEVSRRGRESGRVRYHGACPRCSWHLVHDDYEEVTFFAEQHLKTHLDDTEAALQSAA